MHVVYFSEQEVSEAEEDVFPPVAEVNQQSLQRVLRNVPQLIVHVNGQPGQQVDEFKFGHAIRQQSGNCSNTGPEEIYFWLSFTRDQSSGSLFSIWTLVSIIHRPTSLSRCLRMLPTALRT